jgi:hypothetical protein
MFRSLSTLTCLVSLSVVACLAAPVAAEVARLSVANLKPHAGWSDVKTEGDVQYRVAKKGALRLLPFEAWWKEGRLRPAEDTVFVFEVRYKDTATEPIVAKAAGGLQRYHGPNEVHRFGGTGDGKWKTAHVACGWDQIMRNPETPEMTAIGFRANADLPVASITVRKATAEDEARHNAETRAWVAAAQAEKRKTVELNVRPLELRWRKPEDLPPVVAFPWPTIVPLLQDAQPKQHRIGKPIEVRMCLNELEGGSFGIFANGKDLTGVRYEVGELTGPSGKLIADVIPRTAEYACVRRREGDYFLYPQRLWPAYEVDIPANQSHWFLFNLRTHRGKTKPGTYTGEVTVTSDQGKAKLPIKVEVLPIDLMTMNECGFFMGGCVTGLVPVHDIEFAVDYNQNGINLWYSGIRPKAKIVDNELVLDWTIIDEWMKSAKKRGLIGNVWFLGGNPYGFPNTMTIFRHMNGVDTRNGREPLSQLEWRKKQSSKEHRDKPMPAQRELVVEWVRQMARHARENDWPEQILTPFDEPAKWVQGPYRKSSNYENTEGVIGTGPWIKTYFEDGCKVIREGDPKTRIYGSIHHINYRGQNCGRTFIDDVDVFCTNAVAEVPGIGDEVREAGNTFWQYTGVGNGCTPDRARYSYGFYFAAKDSRGSLLWAYNWGPGFDTTTSRYSWMYAWHTPFDTIPGPYFEGLREAWDDRRIIETYKKHLGDDEAAMAVLDILLKEAFASRAPGGRDTVNDFWAAIDDVGKLDRWRNYLLDGMLEARQAKKD